MQLSRNRRGTVRMQGQEYPATPAKVKKGVRKDNVLSFNNYVEQRKTVQITPKNEKQAEYVDLLLDSSKVIVFATGPAGTGKTMLAVLAAIKALKSGQAKKIVISRPAVGVDNESHGFLPGTLNEKMEPWTRPIFDVLREHYNTRELTQMLEDEVIELSPLSYMRGRTFKDSYIILDEAQSVSMNQMKMILTRIGDNSKLVITGDLNQIDRKFTTDNGLKDFTERLVNSRSKLISVIQFSGADIQRHPVVEEILKLYGEI
jgi:phosphate starvation-inducible PhoH-like protein